MTATTNTGDQLLTLRQVADRLQLTEATLYRWRSTGFGPAGYRLAGGHVRYKASAIEAWLATQADDVRQVV